MKNILLIFLSISVYLPAYSGGDGSEGNPYQIATIADLIKLSKESGDWDKYFIQTADITFDSDEQSVDWDGDGTADWDAGDQPGFSPIGNDVIIFTGSYDGQYHTISNLFINRSSSNYIGFFGYLDGATIQNLGLISCSFAGQQNVGGLAGSAPTAIINNCFSTGTLNGEGPVGGLVGYSVLMEVNNCYSSCNVTGWNALGGFVGYLDIDVTFSGAQPTIRNCYSLGDLTIPASHAFSSAGSFCGYIYYSAIIENCYSIGKINFWQGPVVEYGFVGGEEVVGSTYTNNFFDKEASNQTSGIGATAKTTAQMKTASTFFDAGWSPAVWNIGDGINDGYPYLDWQNPGGTPLPVELTSFTAVSASSATGELIVVLNWTTATEVNNYGFEVARKNPSTLPSLEGMSEGQGWVLLGFVPGHGNSNSPKNYEFIDSEPPTGKLQYRLKQINTDGSFEYYGTIAEVDFGVTGIENPATAGLPTEYSLSQNYPNPFNPSTEIRYQIPSIDALSSVEVLVILKVYDLLGREVAALVNEQQNPGYYEVQFDGSKLASGIYLYKLQAGSYSATKKLMLLK